jgi:hypothetical protein
MINSEFSIFNKQNSIIRDSGDGIGDFLTREIRKFVKSIIGCFDERIQ